ncbi:MAG TPA: hypothetical protein VJG83_00175 [archaeon]|nr:hypothetical protein [archaeon]
MFEKYEVSQLQEAQKYPFLPFVKIMVSKSDLTVENVPADVLIRSKQVVVASFEDRPYNFPEGVSSRDILTNEILAFPVSKILVSIINRMELYRRFSQLFSRSVEKYLEKESSKKINDIASDFGLAVQIFPAGYAVAIGSYLRAELDDPSIKLVNQKVEGGNVFLSKSEFIKLLSLIASSEIRKSLPVQIKEVPIALRAEAEDIDKQFSLEVRKKYSKTDFGKVSPESFPPCMAKIYGELIAGVKVTHSARFAIATFLSSIGMEKEKIIDMYRATPNFNEKITRYQVDRIAADKGGYSAPGCDKMRSYNLCVADCPVTHPVQFYSREVMRGKNGQIPQAGSE